MAYDAEVPYSILSHTADTGVAATAESLPGLVGELAAGMFSLMAKPTGPERERCIEIDLVADSDEELVVDVLAELLYRCEVDDVVFADFDVEMAGPRHVHVVARGVDLADAEPVGPPIKAVTYHRLAVSRAPDGSWEATVYFDV